MFLPLHGAHQADNAAAALAAAECFLERALDDDRRRRVRVGAVAGPARSRRPQPLVVIDGTKNVAGAHAVRAALAEEFADTPRTWVVGVLREKDPHEMLDALGVRRRRRGWCAAVPRARAARPEEVADAALALGVDPEDVEVIDDVPDAVAPRSTTPPTAR